MISICMIFTALATTALAKGSIECNFSESGAQLCFGAVGQQLIFHLSDATDTDIRLTKDNTYIILDKPKTKTVTLHEAYVNGSELFTNGTIKLGKAMKRHSGDYLLEEFGSDGVLLKKVEVHLEIRAPVSKPAVSQTCLSPERMHITCSSEGDDVELTLTLDDLLMMPTGAHSYSPSNRTANMADGAAKLNKSSTANVTISLHGQQTGTLTCQVWNNFSRDETVIHLKICKDFVSSFRVLTVAVIASVVSLLLLVALCLWIIKHNKPRPTTNDSNSVAEVIYADVRIITNTRQTRPTSLQNTSSATYISTET